MNGFVAKWLQSIILSAVTQETGKILAKLNEIEGKVDKINVTEQQLADLLNKLDTTTNKIAANVATIATVDAQISSEIDAFLQNTPAGTVLTDAMSAQLADIGDRAQAASDASDAQVSVLQAIAAKGSPTVPTAPPLVTITPLTT